MKPDTLAFAPDDFEPVGAENLSQVDAVYETQSYWKDILSRFARNKGALVGGFFIVLVLLMALLGPGMTTHTYDSQIIAHQNLAPRVPGLERIGIFDGSGP